MPWLGVVSVPRRLRQEESELQTSLDYVGRPHLRKKARVRGTCRVWGIEAIFKEWSVLHFESCRIACAKSLRQHRAVPVQWGGEEIGGTGEKGWGLPVS